jgi:hypothetical protein
MTRNQLLPKYVKNWSGGVIFTVDGSGNITPTAQTTVYRGQTIVTQAATGGNTTFSGHVCAQQNDVCQCSTLVDGVSSGSHMAIGTGYTVKSSVPFSSEFEIYAVTDSGPVPNASNGDILIGTT